MARQHVLLADDDLETQQLIRLLLEKHHIVVDVVSNGRDAINAWSTRPVDLFILDWMMPVMDGMETLQRIRQLSDIPVILLTVKNQEADIVTGFENGANDYITKPFLPGELLARVRTRLRRGWKHRTHPHRLEYHQLKLDLHSRKVECQGRPVVLSKMEFELLAYLVSHTGLVVSKQELLEQVWGYKMKDEDTNLIEAVVTRLRRKIKTTADCPELIQTVRGTGYRFGE